MKITRTITTKKATAVTMHVDGSVEEFEVIFVGDVKKAEKTFAKNNNAKAVTLKDIEEETLVFAMDVETFMENADEVRKVSAEETAE